MNKRYVLKQLDIIEMKNNIIQVRQYGRIFLFELESEEYKKEFINCLPLFDGKTDLVDIKKQIHLPEDEINKLISNLINYQLIEEFDTNLMEKLPEDYINTYQLIFNIFDRAVYKRKSLCMEDLYNCRITVIGNNDLSIAIISMLIQHGFRHIELISLAGSKKIEDNMLQKPYKGIVFNQTFVDLYDVITGDNLNKFVIAPALSNQKDFFFKINELCVNNDKNFIPLYCEENMAFIGPTVVPRKTPCFKCMDLRVITNIENKDAYIAYNDYLSSSNKEYRQTPANYALIAVNFIQDFIKVVTGYKYAKTFNSVLCIEFYENNITFNNLLKFPKCPVCSNVNRRVTYDNYAYINLVSELRDED